MTKSLVNANLGAFGSFLKLLLVYRARDILNQLSLFHHTRKYNSSSTRESRDSRCPNVTEDLITYKLKMTNGDIVHLHQVGMFIDQYSDTNYENGDTIHQIILLWRHKDDSNDTNVHQP